MEEAQATASAPTTATADECMFSAPIMWADVTPRTAIAVTPGADVLIMVTLLLTIGVPDTTDGLTIRGPRPCITRGDGARRHGTAITALTLRRTRCIRRLHFGSRIT